MKLEHNELPLLFSETPISDIFFTEYLPELSGDCLKLYLYMNFLSKYNKTVKVNDLSKKLSLPYADINSYLEILEDRGLLLKKPSGFVVKNIQEITLNKLYSPNLTMSEEKVKNVAKHSRRSKAIEYINNAYFQGVMGPSWLTDIDLWFEKFNFDEQVMIALFDHCYKHSALKKSYVKTVAESWYSDNIKTMSDLEIYDQKHDHYNKLKNTIAKKLGKKGNLTEYEEDYIKSWVYDYGYDLDIIEIAMRRTTFKQVPTFSYINTLISDWHERGFKTPSQVLKFIEERKDLTKRTKQLEKSVEKASNSNIHSTNGSSKAKYAQRAYKNLDFLYANKKKKEA